MGLSFGGGMATALAARGVRSFFNLKASNTLKARSAMARTDRNAIVACVGPSTVAGQTAPVTTACATGSWPNRLAALLQAQGIPAGASNFFGDHAGYGATATLANLEAGDSRISHTGAATLAAFNTIGGFGFSFPTAASTLVFTPTTNVTKWDIWTRNNGTGRNITASSGTSGSIAINSTAAADVTKTTINAGTAGLNALTLTWVAGAVTIIGVHGYDDTAGRRELSIFNWGISGAVSSRFNESSQSVGGTAAMIAQIAPDIAILADLPINDWRTSVSLATSKANITSVVDSFQAAGSDVILATPIWDNSTTGLAANQNDYANMLFEVAREQDVPLVDTRSSWVSYAAANAAGWYSDNVHPTALGYGVEAVMYSELLRRIRSF